MIFTSDPQPWAVGKSYNGYQRNNIEIGYTYPKKEERVSKIGTQLTQRV